DAGGGVAQLGRAGGVEADDVAFDDVVVRAGARDPDAVAVVAGDDVAPARAGASDGVARGTVDLHAVARVAHVERTGGVGADVVAGDRVRGRPRILKEHTGKVARDDVALGGVVDPVAVRADAVARAATGEIDPGPVIAQGGRPGRVGADVIAGDDA